ncbi:hypothetical protein [Snodgrassella alvi]|uniref:hypothetical protein n=1 Tax=Snodgrassella alvi TaxID=1196083 RepID=UPI000CC291EF|nr:hypothetical protein [Snodgrassella alvi]PIT40275.1 hypothetical protein BHC53_08450 [Snodgrassella alvi]
MAGTVIEVVEGTTIGQGGGDAVAQLVVLMAKGALCGGFAQQVADDVVAKGDDVCFGLGR